MLLQSHTGKGNLNSLLIDLPASTFAPPLAYSPHSIEREDLSHPSQNLSTTPHLIRGKARVFTKPCMIQTPYLSGFSSSQAHRHARTRALTHTLTCTSACASTHLNALTASATSIPFLFLQFVRTLSSQPSPLPGTLSSSDTPDDFLTSFRSLVNVTFTALKVRRRQSGTYCC